MNPIIKINDKEDLFRVLQELEQNTPITWRSGVPPTSFRIRDRVYYLIFECTGKDDWKRSMSYTTNPDYLDYYFDKPEVVVFDNVKSFISEFFEEEFQLSCGDLMSLM